MNNRYYIVDNKSKKDSFRFLVCDKEAPKGSKSIGKFNSVKEAELFCAIKVKIYSEQVRLLKERIKT